MSQAGRSARAKRSGRVGRRSEWLAIAWLSLKGYRLLARRFGGKGGEIDLIMRRGRLVIFVEVKRRGMMEEALVSITPKKRRLVSGRVRQWLAQNPWAMDHDLRFDAVFLAPLRWPKHARGVFELVL